RLDDGRLGRGVGRGFEVIGSRQLRQHVLEGRDRAGQRGVAARGEVFGFERGGRRDGEVGLGFGRRLALGGGAEPIGAGRGGRPGVGGGGGGGRGVGGAATGERHDADERQHTPGGRHRTTERTL